MFDHGPNSATPIFAAGYSMAGTMINETPQQFVAAIGNAPMEAVHGTADTTNRPGWDQAVAAIDPNFHLTQIQGAGHDVWDPKAGVPGYSSDANWSWLFQQQMPGASTLPTPTPTPTPTGNEITATSGGTLTDASGNKWTLTSAGVVDENGAAVPGSSGTAAFAIVDNLYYGQDATTKEWYTYSPASHSWTSSAAPVLTPTPTPTPPPPPTPTPHPTPRPQFQRRPRHPTTQWCAPVRQARSPTPPATAGRYRPLTPSWRTAGRPHSPPTLPRLATSIRRCGRRTPVINGIAGPGQDGAPAMIPCRSQPPHRRQRHYPHSHADPDP